MNEQLDLLGGPPIALGEPKVPGVIFHEASSRRRLAKSGRPDCEHCVMVKAAVHRGLKFPDFGGDLRKFTPLPAVLVITQVDGSTLTLCEQHAQEHEERGDQDG